LVIVVEIYKFSDYSEKTDFYEKPRGIRLIF